jgi:hypothetical protein
LQVEQPHLQVGRSHLQVGRPRSYPGMHAPRSPLLSNAPTETTSAEPTRSEPWTAEGWGTSLSVNVQDTTEINLSHLNSMTGLGEIGNTKNRGLFLHPSLAVSPDGVPIGLLSAQVWDRPPE